MPSKISYPKYKFENKLFIMLLDCNINATVVDINDNICATNISKPSGLEQRILAPLGRMYDKT